MDADCAAIDACVNASSPCVGPNADDPLCDDDCIKGACVLKHPAAAALYAAWQSCQSGAQCGSCEKPCEPYTTPMQRCIVGEGCDLANPSPDACKCSPDKGGSGTGGAPGDGSGDTADCSLQPTCALASADDVNAALGAGITGPVTKVVSDANVTMTQCHYDPDAGAVNEPYSVIITYWSPYSRSDYDAGRSTYESTLMTGTSSVAGVGDAAFFAEVGKDGVAQLTFLSGCVQIQIVGNASVDQLVALAKTIIERL